jgi:regulator of RNase E activity RraA
MDVHPGEIVHMDENGACKFPAAKIEAVLTNAQALLKDEATRLKALRQAKTAAEVRAAASGTPYSAPQRKR